MIGFIIPRWLVFALICICEFNALGTPGDSATITSAPPTRNHTESTESFSSHLQIGKAFQQQNTSITTNRNSSPQSNKGTPLSASDQHRKASRLLRPLIIAIMNQHPVNSGRRQMTSSTDTQKNVSEKNITSKDVQPKKREETNTIEPSDETFIAFTDNTIDNNSSETSKTTSVDNKNDATNSTPTEVTFEHRANFEIDGCPAGYAKVNGKCVPIKN